MPDADRLTAELNRIESHQETGSLFAFATDDSPRLIRVAREVLKLADGWDAEVVRQCSRMDDAHENGEDGTFHLAEGRAGALDDCAGALRETLTRHLIGDSDE